MSLAASGERPSLLAPEGERKFATVLFADVVDSSRLIAGMDPEDADDALLAALQVMTDAVRAHGGTVNQVMGDGVMAVFGVPRAQEDHALRACMAAQAMHAMVRELSHGEGHATAHAIELRVGLASGEVVVKPPMADFDLAYRLVGESVYLAHRLQESAAAGATLLAPATRDLASSAVRVRPEGEVVLKGGMPAVGSFRLLGIESEGRRYSGKTASARSRFVGRADQLSRLNAVLAKAGDAGGGALVVTGETGVGKSRLLAEFLSGLSTSAHRVVRCDLLPHGLARPIDPSAQLVLDLIGEADRTGDLAKGAEEWIETFRSLGIDDPFALWGLLDTVGVRVDDPGWIRLEARERLQAAADGLCQLIRGLGRERRLILLVEDYQWVDSKTRAVLDALAECAGQAPLLVLVTCRSGNESLWSRWSGVEEVAVDPLSRGEAFTLLESLLGSKSDLEDLKHDLAGRTEGNPFFLEECVRALEGSGAFAGEPGDYRLAEPGTRVELPATVQAAVAARIDALEARDRAVLLDASVIGPRVDVELLSDLTGRTRDDLQPTLDRLRTGRFLERSRVIPNLEYSFGHVVIHEVAYDTLLKRRLPLLHARVAAAVRKRSAIHLPGKTELLAYHAFRAKDWPMAYAYGRAAGQRGLVRSANQEAANHFQAALDAFRQLPRSLRKPRREFDVRVDLAQAGFLMSRQKEVRGHLERARSFADAGLDERRRIRALSLTGLYFWYSGDMIRAMEAAEQAWERARVRNDLELELPCLFRLAAFSIDRGRYSLASELFGGAVERIPESMRHKHLGLLGIVSTGCYGTWARGLAELGRFAEAERAADQAITLAEEAGNPFSQIYGRISAGYALLRKGDFNRAFPLLEESLTICKTKRVKSVYGLNAIAFAYACVSAGQNDRGLETLRHGLDHLQHQTLILRPSLQSIWIGETYLLTGRLEQARVRATESLALALKHGERGHEAWALWLLGCLGLAEGRMADVEACFSGAAKIAEQHDMAPLYAHCRIGLARSFIAASERDVAGQHWRAGAAIYRELGMTGWLDRARREVPAFLDASEFEAVR